MFCEFVFDCNLFQHNMVPAHVKGNILDLVLTCADKCRRAGISFGFQCKHLSPPVKPKNIYVLDYSRANLC